MRKLLTFEKYLAITDVEATGTDWDRHEIIEIGLVVARQPDLKTVEEFEVKIRPEKIEVPDPESLEVAGYSPDDWKNAVSLASAMAQYSEKTRDCLFLGYPLMFDFNFIDKAFKKTGVENPMDYHHLDLSSMAWAIFRNEEKVGKVTWYELTQFFGMEPEPTPHRAINGARMTHEILKKTVEYRF